MSTASTTGEPERLRVPLDELDSADELRNADPVPTGGPARWVYELRRGVDFVRTHDTAAVLDRAGALLKEARDKARESLRSLR